MDAPAIVVLTHHAEEQSIRRGIGRAEVAEVVLVHHADRRHNSRSADWVLSALGMAVAYNWPDRGDSTTALVVTVWAE